jgi:hypothetical protein
VTYSGLELRLLIKSSNLMFTFSVLMLQFRCVTNDKMTKFRRAHFSSVHLLLQGDLETKPLLLIL